MKREMRKSKTCPSPLVGILIKHTHLQHELCGTNSDYKPRDGAGCKKHDARDGRQLNTIHYAFFVRKKLRSTFNQAWICLLHLPLPQIASQNLPLIGLRNEEFIYAWGCYLFCVCSQTVFNHPGTIGTLRSSSQRPQIPTHRDSFVSIQYGYAESLSMNSRASTHALKHLLRKCYTIFLHWHLAGSDIPLGT